MSYVALYRKFRPATFTDVKGQDSIVETLKNQIRADRIGHAYLFTGTRGTGKTTIAKIFAKTVNCENPVDGNPCGECESCREIAKGNSMNVIEMDAASNNGVEDVRSIIEEVSYSPAKGKYKVYIVDEAHMLSPAAFNALLKTLEEPPSYVIFILATTEVHKIPITILSRCQRYDFRRIQVETIRNRLEELTQKEKVEAEDKALRYLAKTADGSMRDALSLLDQCIAFHFGEVLTYDRVLEVLGAVDTIVFSKMLRMILEEKVDGCISLLEEIVMQGRELGQFVTEFVWYLRNLLLVKTGDDVDEMIDVSSENLQRLKEEAAQIEEDTVIRYIRVLSDLSGQLKLTAQKRVFVEMSLIRMCHPEMEKSDDSIAERVRILEKKVEEGVMVRSEPILAPRGAVVEEKKAAPLPEALPEEIEQVLNNWQTVVNAQEQPMRTYLKGIRISTDYGNRLLLVTMDVSQYDWIKSREKILLEDLEKQVGRTLQLEIRKADSMMEMDATYPDLSQLIRMDIEEE